MEQIQVTPENKGFQPRAWALIDLDGVRLRWTTAHLPNATDQAELAQTIALYKKEGLGIAVLTNRPPGQMGPIAYDMGVDYGKWVTESGGTVYDPRTNMNAIAPEFVPMIPKVIQIRELLKEAGVQEYPQHTTDVQFEPGKGMVKTVVVLPEGVDKQNYANLVIKPALEPSGLLEEFDIKVGKAIDIDPKMLNKGAGMRLLLNRNGIDVSKTPAIWIADEKRDIEAARVLVEMGGVASAVGNSHPDYAANVRDLGGILAPAETSYHSSFNFILHEFMKRLT